MHSILTYFIVDYDHARSYQANVAAYWLLAAWNEAMANIPSWPRRQPPPGSGKPPVQTLYGRRRQVRHAMHIVWSGAAGYSFSPRNLI